MPSVVAQRGKQLVSKRQKEKKQFANATKNKGKKIVKRKKSGVQNLKTKNITGSPIKRQKISENANGNNSENTIIKPIQRTTKNSNVKAKV